MAIQLPADIELQIRRHIQRGHFPDAAEVVRAALRLLEDQERQLADLRANLHVGLDEADRGETAEWTPELRAAIRQSARLRAQAGEQPDPDVCP